MATTTSTTTTPVTVVVDARSTMKKFGPLVYNPTLGNNGDIIEKVASRIPYYNDIVSDIKVGTYDQLYAGARRAEEKAEPKPQTMRRYSCMLWPEADSGKTVFRTYRANKESPLIQVAGKLAPASCHYIALDKDIVAIFNKDIRQSIKEGTPFPAGLTINLYVFHNNHAYVVRYICPLKGLPTPKRVDVYNSERKRLYAISGVDITINYDDDEE